MVKELDSVTSALFSRGLRLLLFKGPALDEVYAGTAVRLFSDLDIMVRREDLRAATEILGGMGYVQIGGDHPFHLRVVRRSGAFPVVVELHFDLSDPRRGYAPDLEAIWNRSVRSGVFHSCLVPEMTDHLLLVAMQLPHHHWAPRLVVDIGRMVFHGKERIDWDALAVRARAWGMRAVAGAALYVASSLLDIRLPAAAWTFCRPENYVRRVQWNVAARASADQFLRPRSRVAPLAACLLVDRTEQIPRIVFWQLMCGAGIDYERRGVSGITRRLLRGAIALPVAGRLMVGSLLARHSFSGRDPICELPGYDQRADEMPLR
jgi:hypothetical protein